MPVPAPAAAASHGWVLFCYLFIRCWAWPDTEVLNTELSRVD